MAGRRYMLILVLAVLASAAPVGVQAQHGVGFRLTGGWQEVGGDYSAVLDGHVDAEFSVLWGFSNFRVGGGANWVSFPMDDVDETWSQVKSHFLIGYPFGLGSRLRGYVEGRLTYRRLRPEGTRYTEDVEEELGDFVAAGRGGEIAAGVEVPFGRRWAVDVSGAYGRFNTDRDLSSQGLGPIDSGATWRVHAGVTVFPTY